MHYTRLPMRYDTHYTPHPAPKYRRKSTIYIPHGPHLSRYTQHVDIHIQNGIYYFAPIQDIPTTHLLQCGTFCLLMSKWFNKHTNKIMVRGIYLLSPSKAQ